MQSKAIFLCTTKPPLQAGDLTRMKEIPRGESRRRVDWYRSEDHGWLDQESSSYTSDQTGGCAMVTCRVPRKQGKIVKSSKSNAFRRLVVHRQECKRVGDDGRVRRIESKHERGLIQPVSLSVQSASLEAWLASRLKGYLGVGQERVIPGQDQNTWAPRTEIRDKAVNYDVPPQGSRGLGAGYNESQAHDDGSTEPSVWQLLWHPSIHCYAEGWAMAHSRGESSNAASLAGEGHGREESASKRAIYNVKSSADQQPIGATWRCSGGDRTTVVYIRAYKSDFGSRYTVVCAFVVARANPQPSSLHHQPSIMPGSQKKGKEREKRKRKLSVGPPHPLLRLARSYRRAVAPVRGSLAPCREDVGVVMVGRESPGAEVELSHAIINGSPPCPDVGPVDSAKRNRAGAGGNERLEAVSESNGEFEGARWLEAAAMAAAWWRCSRSGGSSGGCGGGLCIVQCAVQCSAVHSTDTYMMVRKQMYQIITFRPDRPDRPDYSKVTARPTGEPPTAA
ncbi:hypothetical protein B0J11DRAFT_511964 [Dendryphion nanum]|uniref:Uncharacterized protein n=1 Tax=Dendryphion nanum TaxID=256645 RepID=A0A9P9D473_9PLEO|nr:hypothetical protein B0J11DRAFT_511964 [Dendryphion nanum]